MPVWVQLVWLLCAVCFILALKGLSGPKTARSGNLQQADAMMQQAMSRLPTPRAGSSRSRGERSST